MRELSLSSIQISDAQTGDIWEFYLDSAAEGETEYDLLITGHARLLHDGTTGALTNIFEDSGEPDTQTGVASVAEPGAAQITPLRGINSRPRAR